MIHRNDDAPVLTTMFKLTFKSDGKGSISSSEQKDVEELSTVSGSLVDGFSSPGSNRDDLFPSSSQDSRISSSSDELDVVFSEAVVTVEEFSHEHDVLQDDEHNEQSGSTSLSFEDIEGESVVSVEKSFLLVSSSYELLVSLLSMLEHIAEAKNHSYVKRGLLIRLINGSHFHILADLLVNYKK